MVGPIPEGERRLATRRLAAGFVALVALSAALTAAYSGATLPEMALVAGTGLLVGAALLVAIGA